MKMQWKALAAVAALVVSGISGSAAMAQEVVVTVQINPEREVCDDYSCWYERAAQPTSRTVDETYYHRRETVQY